MCACVYLSETSILHIVGLCRHTQHCDLLTCYMHIFVCNFNYEADFLLSEHEPVSEHNFFDIIEILNWALNQVYIEFEILPLGTLIQAKLGRKSNCNICSGRGTPYIAYLKRH